MDIQIKRFLGGKYGRAVKNDENEAALFKPEYDLFEMVSLAEVQKLQDLFAEAMGVFSLIVNSKGEALTRGSNYCAVCRLLCGNEAGNRNCMQVQAEICRSMSLHDKNAYEHCRAAGLLYACTPISVNGRRIGNWVVGQIKIHEDAKRISDYARQIGVDEKVLFDEYQKMPRFSQAQVEKTLNLVGMFASMIAVSGHNNILLAQECSIRKSVEKSLKKNEAFLQSVVEQMPSAVFVKNAETLQFILYNKAGEALFGCPTGAVIGKTMQDLLPQAQADFFMAKEKEALREKRAVELAQERITTRHEGDKIIHARLIPLAENIGNGNYLLGIVEDVTERKRMLDSLREVREALEQRNTELKELSLLDGLTGIANRRNLDAFLDKEWRRAQRKESSLALIMLDIDQFKNYNDTYGHQEGDACLQRIAQAIKEAGRRVSDLAARFGGEEFAVVLPDTDQVGAAALAEVLRRNIENLDILHEASSVSSVVTASFGVAAIVPTRRSSIAEFIAAADQALYQAKREGRNRVKLAESIEKKSDYQENLAKSGAFNGSSQLIFGINPFLSSRFIWENYVPILKEVAREVGLQAQINIVADYDALGEGLLNKTIDIGWFSPLAYVLTKLKGEIIPLVTPVVNQQPSYFGYIIARKDQEFESLADLQGTRFGFVDPQSASGYLYPASLLLEQGQTPEKFFKEVVFLGNHQRVINAVLEGVVDAGATYSEAMDNAAMRGVPLEKLVILEKSKPIPKDAIAARADMDKELLERLKQAFIAVTAEDERYVAFMKNTAINGFVVANDCDYEILRATMKVK